MKKLNIVCLLLLSFFLSSACSTTNTETTLKPVDVNTDSHQIVYDTLSVKVETSQELDKKLAIEGKKQAAGEGFKMMASAPVGCLSGGLFAGFCLAMAPFFPVIAAVRSENPDVAKAEAGAVGYEYQKYGLKGSLHTRITTRIQEASLPLIADQHQLSQGKHLILTAIIETPGLAHSGYKKGKVSVTLPYRFELTDKTGKLILRRHGERYREFTQSDLEGGEASKLFQTMGNWVDSIAEEGVRKSLLEWQPGIQLAAIKPHKVEKRSPIGMKYTDWTLVEAKGASLEWQALETILSPQLLADITEISYEIDILVWVVKSGHPPEWRNPVVRSARNLPLPVYEIEFALRPCTTYQWKPRARFRYQGNLHQTSTDEIYNLKITGGKCKRPDWGVSEEEFEKLVNQR